MNQLLPANSKFTFTTRRVVHSDIQNLNQNFEAATSGDLVLATVTRIGSHKRVQLACGRNSDLHVGDHVVLCCGSRYAPDQFEGVANLSGTKCDLLAGGGVIGRMREKHAAISRPTQLRALGLLTDSNNEAINIQRYAIPHNVFTRSIPVIAVTGAAMNSGKTTTAFSLANGLAQSNLRVAAIKITGTGAFGDFNAFLDAGAHSALDFTDAGMVTTYKQSTQRIMQGAESLLAEAESSGADVAVVELGDGILQKETASILAHPLFKSWLRSVLFAAPDALSAIAGVDYLQREGLPLLAVSGMLTRSPLLCKEFSRIKSIPVFDKGALCQKETAIELLARTFDLSRVA